MPSTSTVLENWNRLEQPYAMETILPFNGSKAWAIGVVNLYPFDTPEELFAAADKVWLALPEADWQQAFDSHPRIGELHAKAATAQSLALSAAEQSAASPDAANPDAATQAALAAANAAYEQKFGRIFIVCATGKTAAEMLALCRQRLNNDPATELRQAAEQQRQITQLRLHQWLQVPSPSTPSDS
jgi:2-oxo-4-hydroxy-4-carboxy-5-ureidoimidazoline decarboxylase